jgi:hypothetical protein
MKNIQVAEDCDNFEGLIFALTDEEFAIIFPAEGQDIEFVEDLKKRLGRKAETALKGIWSRPVAKTQVKGIHGTLFDRNSKAQRYYPTKKRAEMIRTPLDVRPG